MLSHDPLPRAQDAICTSLSEYNAHIDDLKAEMQGATDSARNIRSDIQDIRNKSVLCASACDPLTPRPVPAQVCGGAIGHQVPDL